MFVGGEVIVHGVVNKALERFTIDTYGFGLWQKVVSACPHAVAFYEAMLCYPDQDSYALLNQLSRILNKPNADILEDMGTYLVVHRNQDGVRRLLRFGGVDFRDFLFSLNEFNARIDLIMPDLNLPQIGVVCGAKNQISIRLAPSWSEFIYLCIGILHAMADDYGALIRLAHFADTGSAVIQITLVDDRFAVAQGFKLAARGPSNG